ncbi:MAG: DivIVA domain-containing protein [Clostridium sp.]|nr:DivIVA domain-containing protein [Clostridium sp.]MCM1444236.1 DivIVA domain-containing protein [Candidatus Amulumruptor caecigallinarius]
MYEDRVLLTSQDILEKDFKMDTRGYRPQEVDKFLDVIMRDYDEMGSIIKELKMENKMLTDDNIKLKQEIRMLNSKIDVLKTGEVYSKPTNNSDLLRRISKLEEIIYGRDE